MLILMVTLYILILELILYACLNIHDQSIFTSKKYSSSVDLSFLMFLSVKSEF